MLNKLEELRNKLIEKGWRIENPNARISDVKYMYGLRELRIVYERDRREVVRKYPIRFLVSKESNLRQFVCENGMINVDETEVYYFWLKRKGTLDRGHYYLSEAGEDIRTNNFEYRLIESSLKYESELESFILDNIKVEGTI